MIEFIIIVIAIVYLVTQATITMPIRLLLLKVTGLRLGPLYCPSCVGFWVGVLVAASGYHEIFPDDTWVWALVKSGLTAMVACHVWSGLTGGNPAWQVEQAIVYGVRDESEEKTENGQR